MSQMMGRGLDGQSKTLACDDDGNLFTVPAPASDFSVLIPNGENLSDAIDIGGRTLGVIAMPAAWTDAALTFQASLDGETYFDLLDQSGTEVNLTVAANDFLHLTLSDWIGLRYLKVRSGTSGSPVNQDADRTIGLVAVAAT